MCKAERVQVHSRMLEAGNVPRFDPNDHPHRRYDPLTDAYVLVSPHRTKRPWQGRVEPVTTEVRPAYDPTCYLCPGNARAGGHRNPDYVGTFVFENDFAALLPDAPDPPPDASPLLRATGVRGTSEVLCFSPRHDLTLAQLDAGALRRVVDLWAERTDRLGARWRWVQVFENKGEVMGCSNPHPHGQIWAMDALPTLATREDDAQRRWRAQHGESLLVAYHAVEREAGERTVVQTDHWSAVVPWWATWPYELLITPRRHVLRMPDLTDEERSDLATLLGRTLPTLDALFETSFPYTMGWHGAPTGPGHDREDHGHWQLHAHLYPPLLRSATVKKFMVGFEMMAETQRDLTPERAAERLRSVAQGGPS